MGKIYCNTLLSRKESKVCSGYCKLGRPDLQIVRNCNYCYYCLLGAKYHSLYPGFTLMISRNPHSSPIIPVIQAGHQGSERLRTCPKSHSSCGTGDRPPASLLPTAPHFSPLSEPQSSMESTSPLSTEVVVCPHLFYIQAPWEPHLGCPADPHVPSSQHHCLRPVTPAPAGGAQGHAYPTPTAPLGLGNSSSLFMTYPYSIPTGLAETRKLDYQARRYRGVETVQPLWRESWPHFHQNGSRYALRVCFLSLL